MNKICETLAASSLFSGLNDDVCDEYCGRTSVKSIGKGEILVSEGDPCTGIGLIVDGQLALQKYSGTGDYTTLDLLGSGEIFGDNLIFSNKRSYSSTIEAVADTKIIFISREVLMTLLDRNPTIMQNFLMILSDRVLSQSRRISLLSQRNLRQKISNYLLELLQNQIKAEGRSARTPRHALSTQAVELPVSKEVVSRLLAIPRPSFSRELMSMARDGLIKVSGRVIWLLDLDRLEQGLLESFN